MSEATLVGVMPIVLLVMISGALPLGVAVVSFMNRRDQRARTPKRRAAVPPNPADRSRVAAKLGRAAVLASMQERQPGAQAHDGVKRVHDNHMNEARR